MGWVCFCTGRIMANTQVANGTHSYEDRQKIGENRGEELFMSWGQQKGYVVTRIGSDSRDNYIPNFFRLSNVLRNMPDFVLNTASKTFVVSVKGTANIKLKEMAMLDDIIAAYSSDRAPLIYAFCFKGHEPVLMSIDTLKQRFAEAENKQWHDGVIYRTIKI